MPLRYSNQIKKREFPLAFPKVLVSLKIPPQCKNKVTPRCRNVRSEISVILIKDVFARYLDRSLTREIVINARIYSSPGWHSIRCSIGKVIFPYHVVIR
jgi:hypothetical protein